MTLVPDRRGQSVQIGALFLFVVLLVALSGYQAVVVPQQNAEAEFNHDQRIQPEFVELRNDVMRTAASGTSGFSELTLGTHYPPRLFALNPSPPTGTVRTTAPEPIVVSAVDDGERVEFESVCRGPDETRALEYRARYNEYDGAPTYRLENTVAYRAFDDDVQRPNTGQRIVSGGTINLVPIRGEFERGGVESVSVEPIAGQVQRTTVEDPHVELPTRLDADRWRTLLESELDEAELDELTVEDGRLTVRLDGTYTLLCSPVGIGELPESSTRFDGALSDQRPSGALNPDGADAVALEDVSLVENDEALRLTFENHGEEDRTFESGRFTLFYDPDPTRIAQSLEIVETGDELELRGEYRTLADGDGIVIEAESTTELTVRFDTDRKVDSSLLGISFLDDRNRESIYVAAPDKADPDGSDPSIDSLTVEEDHQNNRDRYQIAAEVSDPDGELDRVEFELRDPDAGTLIDTDQDGVAGESDTADGMVRSESNGQLPEYELVVTVFDEEGNTDQETRILEGTG